MIDEIRRGKAGEANAVYPLLAAQIAKQQYWANARGVGFDVDGLSPLFDLIFFSLIL